MILYCLHQSTENKFLRFNQSPYHVFKERFFNRSCVRRTGVRSSAKRPLALTVVLLHPQVFENKRHELPRQGGARSFQWCKASRRRAGAGYPGHVIAGTRGPGKRTRWRSSGLRRTCRGDSNCNGEGEALSPVLHTTRRRLREGVPPRRWKGSPKSKVPYYTVRFRVGIQPCGHEPGTL